MADLASLLPAATHEHADEHEIKLALTPEAPIEGRVERIERLASSGRGAAAGKLAREIAALLRIDEVAAVDDVERIDRFSVYLDTPGLDLYRVDASLRTRRRGNGKCRVNAKRQDARGRRRGHLVRREWRYNLGPDVYAFLEACGFRPLLEHHFGDLLGAALGARAELVPIVQIHKRSTRVAFTGPGSQRFLLSLDRFRGFDGRRAGRARATRELREIEIEARNGKASRALGAIRAPLQRLTGVEPGRPKYQALAEALEIDEAPAPPTRARA